MRKELFIILTLITLVIYNCRSQDSSSYAKFDYNGNEFSSKMNAYVRKHSNTLSGYMATSSRENETFRHAMDTACEVGVALIKFKVKSSGIVEVACTKGTRQDLAKIFKEAVIKSSKYWKAGSNEEINYILPIHYNFRSNCKGKQVKKENMESNYIFYFDDGIRLEETPCIVLRSWKFLSGVNETF